MGLCKCPKKKVTNLFCFEHRVNVCENCLVEGHPKCVVQSYLQWLQDSDYNPNCSLCNKNLQDEDCIRLCCYDVFHWRCLDQRMRQLPGNTAPAGYECPLCARGVIPADNAAGPVVDGVRWRLRAAGWARAAIGHSPLPAGASVLAARPEASAVAVSQRGQSDSVELLSEQGEPPQQQQQHKQQHKQQQSVVTKKNAGQKFRSAPPPARAADVDENKYARRSAFTWLHWLLRSRSAGRQQPPLSPRRRLLLLGLLIFLAAGTALYLLSALGRQAADSDPLLRPELNPHIRVQRAPAE